MRWEFPSGVYTLFDVPSAFFLHRKTEKENIKIQISNTLIHS